MLPLQSKQMFAAIKGNGGEARLVMLPDESIENKAKQSVYHMLCEMDNWLNKYLKQKKP